MLTLSQHPKLDGLFVNGWLTDEVVGRLAPLSHKLRELHIFTSAITQSPITAKGRARLLEFENLEELELEGNQGSPTDEDLPKLATLPRLKRLTLRFPEKSFFVEDPDARRLYTPAGIESFRKTRPDVNLTVDGMEYPASKLEPNLSP